MDVIIYLSREEENLIKKRKRRRFLFSNPIEISKEYSFLEDREIVKVGNIKVEAIHTPGHTIGHMSYLLDDRFLFTGDLLILKNDEVKPFYYVLHIVNAHLILNRR